MPLGERHHRAKLTESIVREIHARRVAGESSEALSVEFSVSVTTVHEIAAGQAWKDLGLPNIPYVYVSKKRYYTKGRVYESADEAAEGEGVSKATIFRWVSGYRADGIFYEPRLDCWAVLKSEDNYRKSCA